MILHLIDSTKEYHYESFLVENTPSCPELTEIRRPNCRERSQWNESLQITIKKLRRGIKMMKNGRSSESGGIIPELIKCGKEYLGKYLLQLINSCLEQNKISSGKNFM
jgi:hypothetical protein